MRLRAIYETENEQVFKTFYKGMTRENFEKFKRHRIPGFLADLDMAFNYITLGQPTVIIAVKLNINEIIDRRHEIGDMCGGWQDKRNDPNYQRLRSSIWWANSGGHGMRGVYCGMPVDDYEIILEINSHDDYHAAMKNPAIRKILDKDSTIAKRDAEYNDKNYKNDDGTPLPQATWHDFSNN